MRLYLNADSKNHMGYTPDWLRVSYEENGETLELTLDIQGDIDYSQTCLSCRCKGDLIPWVLWNCETGDETDLSSLSEEEIDDILPIDKIAEIICKSDIYEVGLYPIDDENETYKHSKDDVLSNCEGSIEIYVDENHYYTKDFDFIPELNIY